MATSLLDEAFLSLACSLICLRTLRAHFVSRSWPPAFGPGLLRISGSTGLVELGIDGSGRLGRDALDAFQFFLRCGQEPLG
jgi:hypothetical protein